MTQRPEKDIPISISEPDRVANFLSSLGLQAADLELLAIEKEWQKETPKKITAPNLITALCEESVDGTPSFNDLASALHSLAHNNPSKQAVNERSNDPCHEMIKAVLQLAIENKITTNAHPGDPEIFGKYERVLVQDSTIIKLPEWLFEEFSGVANGSSKVCNARIQAVYDLKSMSFVTFSIDCYSKNDLAAAPELELREGDLVLRDRGYLTKGEVKRHRDAGAYFIYRHKTGYLYLDAQTGEPLELLEILRKQGRLDREVILNDGLGTPVRLVAAPVDRTTADERRRKAKKETKGRNPSRAVLDLMDWTIFITNLSEKVEFDHLLAIYGLRWRIEIIFKAWKSTMNFHVIHRVSALELRICLTASLITITVGTGHLFKLCHARIYQQTGRDLSMIKFSKYLSKDIGRMRDICQWLKEESLPDEQTNKALVKYCCYEKRKRLNYHQKQRQISTP